MLPTAKAAFPVLMRGLSRRGLTLRGWIDVTSGKDQQAKKSIKYFDDALRLCEGPPCSAC